MWGGLGSNGVPSGLVGVLPEYRLGWGRLLGCEVGSGSVLGCEAGDTKVPGGLCALLGGYSSLFQMLRTQSASSWVL